MGSFGVTETLIARPIGHGDTARIKHGNESHIGKKRYSSSIGNSEAQHYDGDACRHSTGLLSE